MYFPVHAHSEYSWLDGMGTVSAMVAKVVKHDQPALALTDHGVMAGVIKLYKECRKAGLTPFPGEEFYVVRDLDDPEAKKRRYHVGLLALDAKGFRALLALSTKSHEQFWRKPLIDFTDLATLGAEAGKHVALTTGCYFGLPVQMLIHEGPEMAERMVSMYARWFPHTFVELQNHGVQHDITSDDEIAVVMNMIAVKLGLPVVAGQDSHYCDLSHQPIHDIMKDIAYKGGEGEDNRFPGDVPYHLASTQFMRRRFPDQWDSIVAGHDYLLGLNKLRLPELDNYQFRIPKTVSDPDLRLKKEAELGLSKLHLDVIDTYEHRLKNELGVIKTMGMSGYFLIVKDVTDWCRGSKIIVNARGSVNGSLVAYALGITNVDPIEWETSFDRFLSLDRQKPPDIDLDVESRYRQDLIEYVRSKYPSMCHQGTYLTLGITEEQDEGGEGEDKGSLFVQYRAAKRSADKSYGGFIPESDREMLNQLALMKVRKAPGVHAAGLVLPGEGLAIEDYLAKMWIASSKKLVTQAVMEDVEDCGYVKLDILGLRALETINLCNEMLGHERGYLGWIPWDDTKALRVLRSGKTDGIFQFEGYATMMGAKRMQVRSTLDVIFCLALFRPAMMDSGMTDRYLENRELKRFDTVHPLIDAIMKDTWGVPVFQEQVIEIMRRVGLPYSDLNDVIKAVKASNDKIVGAEEVFRRVKPNFLALCRKEAFTEDEANAAWAVIERFSDYGFNRAHATSYGHMSYRMAYMKAHHPLEFMGALLASWAGTKKEARYVQESRRLGHQIVRPDINHSGVVWAVDSSRKDPSLRKGLVSIGGVGWKAADAIVEERRANGPFVDMDDLVDRVPGRPVSGGKSWKKDGTLNGVLEELRRAGALRSLGLQRED